MLGLLALAAVASGVSTAAAAAPQATAISRPPTPLRLSPGEMLKLAELAQAKGDEETASAIYRALERNPDPEIRAEARFRWARGLAAQGREREAAELLRRLLGEKPEASGVRLELARLLQGLGDPDAALRELRAVQASGIPASVARMVDRFSDAVRASRPIGFSVEIAVAPDSNINHATRSDTLGTVIGDFEIDEDSKAKSGIGAALRGQAFRRLALGGGGNAVLARASLSADLYARHDFNDIVADVAAGPELRLGRSRLNLELGVTQRWFGQKPFLRSARVGATWTRPLGGRTQVRLAGSAALIDNAFNALQDGTAYSAQLSVERALSATSGIAVGGSVSRQDLKDPGYSTSGWRASLTGWRDFGRATLTATADIGRLEADERLSLFPDKRRERSARLSLAMAWRQFSIGGFAPLTRVTFERNRSTIEFYDYRRTRTELALVRAF